MKVLVTGARLPAALEMTRALSAQGAEVYTADTVRFAFARHTRSAKAYYRIPSPVHHYQGFKTAIIQIAREQKIDLVVPISEEIFFLARFASELPCKLLAPSFELLRELHSKLDFQKYFAHVPETKLVHNSNELSQVSREFGEVVIKREFSRGAIGTLVRPAKFDAVEFPVLVQKFAAGPEVCTYSIAREGRLLAHSAYEPRYRYGHGASVYFRSVHNDDVLKLVKDFVSRTNYTGQIAFDFILTDQGPVALECNPRATSGIHLLSLEQIASAVLGTSFNSETQIAPAGVSCSAKLTLLMTNVVSPKDFIAARDTAFQWSDPLPFFSQFASVFELIYRSRKWKMNAGDAFGYDLEWNGTPIE